MKMTKPDYTKQDASITQDMARAIHDAMALAQSGKLRGLALVLVDDDACIRRLSAATSTSTAVLAMGLGLLSKEFYDRYTYRDEGRD